MTNTQHEQVSKALAQINATLLRIEEALRRTAPPAPAPVDHK